MPSTTGAMQRGVTAGMRLRPGSSREEGKKEASLKKGRFIKAETLAGSTDIFFPLYSFSYLPKRSHGMPNNGMLSVILPRDFAFSATNSISLFVSLESRSGNAPRIERPGRSGTDYFHRRRPMRRSCRAHVARNGAAEYCETRAGEAQAETRSRGKRAHAREVRVAGGKVGIISRADSSKCRRRCHGISDALASKRGGREPHARGYRCGNTRATIARYLNSRLGALSPFIAPFSRMPPIRRRGRELSSSSSRRFALKRSGEKRSSRHVRNRRLVITRLVAATRRRRITRRFRVTATAAEILREGAERARARERTRKFRESSTARMTISDDVTTADEPAVLRSEASPNDSSSPD